MTLARFFVFFGGLFVVALFAALIGPLFIDWTTYRADFEREASRILGHPVTVNGSADASLLPFPSVTFNDVRVGGGADGDQAGDEAMMRIARFSMDAELAPFLSGEMRIFDMRIDEPTVRIEIGENGGIDWAMRSPTSLPGNTVVLERVTVSDATIIVADLQNGRTHRIDDLASVISAESLSGPWRMEGTGVVGGRSGAFSLTTGSMQADGGIRLRSRFLPDDQPVSLELEGTASLSDLKPVYSGSFTLQALDLADADRTAAAGDEPQVSLRGTGLFQVDNQRLRIDEYRLEVGAREDPYIVTGEATIDTGEQPDFLLVAEGQQIDVDRLRAGAGAQTEEEDVPVLTAGERIATFRRIVESIPVPDLPGRVNLALPAIIAGDTVLREVRVDARPDGEDWLVDMFSAALPGRTQLEADGRLRIGGDFGFVGSLLLASNQPSGFAAWVSDTVHPAIRGLQAAGFSAEVDLSDGLQRFENLEIAIGEATLSGRFERLDSGPQPKLSMDISGDTVDLDALNALVSLFAGDDDKRVFETDIAARLRADRFQALGTDMAGIDASITLQDGILDIERLTIRDLAGAAIDADGVLSDIFSQPQGRAVVTLQASRTDALFELLQSHAGSLIDISPFVRNASLFGDTSLTVDLQLGSARDRGDIVRQSGYDLQVRGTTGGSSVELDVSSDETIAKGLAAPIDARFMSSNPRADVLLAQLGLPTLPFALDEPAAFSAAIEGRLADEAAVDFDFEADSSQVTGTGRLSVADRRLHSGHLRLALRSQDLEPYLLLAGIGLPGFGSGLPAMLDAELEIEDDAWDLSAIDATLAGNAVSGALTVSRKGTPQVAGALDLDILDLGWLGEALYGQAMRSPTEAGWSNDGFLSMPGFGIGADIALEAARAYLGTDEPAERVTARLAYDNGEMRLSDITGDWLGGSVSGNLTMANASGAGAFSLQMQLADAYLARALAWQAQPMPISARADVSMSLDATGKSPAALVAGLTGSGVAQFTDLRIGGFEDGALDDILAAVDAEDFQITEKTVRTVAQQATAGGVFSVDRASIPFTVAGGVVRAANVTLENAGTALRGEGRLGLTDGMVDAGFDVTFEAGEETLPGATPTIALNFAGPANGPTRTMGVGELTNFLSLRAYERERRRVETVQAGVLEKQRLRREAARLRAVLDDRAWVRRARERTQSRIDRITRERPTPDTTETENGLPDSDTENGAADIETENTAPEPISPEPVFPGRAPLPEPAPASPATDDARQSPGTVEPEAAPEALELQALPRLNFEGLPGVNDIR